MQFELTKNTPDAGILASVLHPLDPKAQITLDAHHGLLEVISTISANQIVGALEQLGCVAKPLGKDTHISGGSTCCGGCA